MLLVLFCAHGCSKVPKQRADLVVIHGKLWTGVDGAPDAGALAVAGDKIIAVGSDTQIKRYIGPQTQTIDAGGRRVVPGLTDSHIHTISGGLQLGRLNLRRVPDRQAFVDAITHAAKAKRPGQWVLGGRWSVDSWSDASSPTRYWIDAGTGNVPVFLNRMDGHQALVNSAALRLAGIDASGPGDPKGGEIERDSVTNEPTGILKESAMELVSKLIPPASEDDLYDALLRAMKHLNGLGFTAVQDMSAPEHLPVFRRAYEEGTLTVRVLSYVMDDDWDKWGPRAKDYQPSGNMHQVAGLKGFMDGSLGSRTAYMRKPFSDATEDTRYPRGQLTAFADPPDKLNRAAIAADTLGLQLAVHAIGDEANHLLLNAYESAVKTNGRRDARHRVEHAQHLHVEDIPRFASLGVVASMQPFHKADDGRYAQRAIGLDRLKGSYAYRQLVDSGATVCFGSDWPVVTADPFAGIDSAVNAQTLAQEVWLPSHSLTVEEALRAYTVTPAYAGHQEDIRGTLEVGKLADFVVLSSDILSVPKTQVKDVRAILTAVGGQVVYSHKNQ